VFKSPILVSASPESHTRLFQQIFNMRFSEIQHLFEMDSSRSGSPLSYKVQIAAIPFIIKLVSRPKDIFNDFGRVF
jgi:hypothetical protein